MKYAILFSMLMAAGAHGASCEYPEQVTEVPNGDTATTDEMVAAQQTVKSYVASMEAYITCLNEASEAVVGDDEEVVRKQRYVLLQKHNAAIDAMEAIADQFNVSVRAFKARDSAE